MNGLKWGFTNGSVGSSSSGLTNGLVNGSGAINGFRLSYQGRKVKLQDVKLRKKLAVVAILTAIWIAVPYAAIHAFPKENVEIDGYFLDWANAQVYHDVPDASNQDISIHEYAMKRDSDGTYFYLSTDGQILAGRNNGADGFYIFIDRDCNPATGYIVRGLGADALVEVVGWNGSVRSASTAAFSPLAQRTDFGGFLPLSTPEVAVSGGKLELHTSIVTCTLSRALIVSKASDSSSDLSEINFRTKGAALRVVENHDASSVIPTFGVQHILTLNLTGKGPSASIEGLVLDYLGNTTPNLITVLEDGWVLGTSNGRNVRFDAPLKVDDELVTLDVSVEVLADSTYGSIGLTLNATEGIQASANISWSIDYAQHGAKVSYIGQAPGKIAIDGAFGDWDLRAPLNDLLGDAYSRKALNYSSGNVDIDTVKVASTTSDASFYMSVNGTMLGGTSVPSDLVRFVSLDTPASNFSGVIFPRYGSDFAFVFIDQDGNKTTGFEVGGAEVAIAVVGKINSIQSSRVFAYVDGGWVEIGSAGAALDKNQLEVSASYELLGLEPGLTYSITFMAEDWNGREDNVTVPLPARVTAGSRAYPGILINEIYCRAPPKKGDDWIEFYNTALEPISLLGYEIWVNGVLVYTFPDIVLESGELYVVGSLSFEGGSTFVLMDPDGAIVDQVTMPATQATYGRTGAPPYTEWANLPSTPGELNPGQLPIPEWGNLLAGLSIVPIILIAIRRAKRPRSKNDT